jgi:Lrp/AsnC family transcriptional regulator, leucine-responsive regulatory protein
LRQIVVCLRRKSAASDYALANFVTGLTMPIALDQFDYDLLDLLQSDCQLTHSALGEKVNLSASAVRRRIERMRAEGVIEREVAVLGAALRQGITVIVSLTFAQESPAIYDEFRRRMLALSEVTQCYSVAGSIDFFLIVAAKNPASYEQWGEQHLMSDSNIKRYESHVVWSEVKFTLRRPRFDRDDG